MNPIQDNIVSILEIDKLPQDEQQEMILRVGALIYQNILMRSLEAMTEEDQNEFDKLLDKEPEPYEVFTFLKDKVKDFEKIMQEEIIKFKNKSSSIMDQIG